MALHWLTATLTRQIAFGKSGENGMLAVVHVGVAHTDEPGQFSQHLQARVLAAHRRPSFKSSLATHSPVRSAETELGASGVPGGDAPGHVVVAPRGGPGVSLRMRTTVGHRLRVTPLKSRNVEWNPALSQLIANSMTGLSGAHAHALALEHGNGRDPLESRAERMVNSAKMLLRRSRHVIL